VPDAALGMDTRRTSGKSASRLSESTKIQMRTLGAVDPAVPPAVLEPSGA